MGDYFKSYISLSTYKSNEVHFLMFSGVKGGGGGGGGVIELSSRGSETLLERERVEK